MTDLAMKLQKRWGQRPPDNRSWPAYNEQLVRRGEFLLDLDWVCGWSDELKKMNEDKIGHPFEYPDSLIRLQGIWHAMNISYRMIEGITRRLYLIAQLPAYNDYTTTSRRINKLDVQLEIPAGKKLMLFADGTGFQAIEGGEYLRSKYGKKNRRWIQVIILADPETKEPVSFEVHAIPVSEADSAERQMSALIERDVDIAAFGGDGGFDKIKLWNYLEKRRIRPIIKPDKNARDDTESTWRNLNVKFQNEFGYHLWSSKLKYGRRWPATEGIFSAVKRMFGEQLAGKSVIGMVQEVKMKFVAYQTMKKYGMA